MKQMERYEEKPLATFQVITDTHIRDDAGHIHNRHFEAALEDMADFCTDSLGIMHVGDVTDRGMAAEYREFSRIWESRPSNLPHLYVTLGNHDIGAVLWEEGGTPVDLTSLSGFEIEDALDGRLVEGWKRDRLKDKEESEDWKKNAAGDSGMYTGSDINIDTEANAETDIDINIDTETETETETDSEESANPQNAAESIAAAAAEAGLDLSGLAARLSSTGEDALRTRELWERRMRRFAEATGEAAPYHDHWLGGYHFIFLGSETPHPKDCDLSAAQLEWLKERLAEEASPDRPVFVFLHQPLMDTVAGSMQEQGWYGVNQDAELKKVLTECPQAILFSGHTHWQLEAKRTMYDGQGVMPSMFNASSVGYLWTDQDDHLTGSEGLQVEIYENRVVVRGRDFVRRSWIERAEYTVTYPVRVPLQADPRS
ncbi:metallophosphoesterase family protein [Saccharibacillus kuerlensis]|uniref:Calcineurin-like phosphoesterase domain-containing protein n=1 Tax=Saccharibacillus kuerlensis TaxID=459527 RepID=A0ABQ2LA29_9BACL|nr:metallophosphoesterase [Saccharibacillus kuerlensis]GGO08165.1 hypothetical protein GCM10010969_37380 [Saccharibacillus kuerlensis]